MSNYRINTSALSGVHTARSIRRGTAQSERPRHKSAILRGGSITLRLNFRLTVTLIFFANIYGPLAITTYAAGSFYTKKLCSRIYSTDVDFYSKNEKIAF